MFNKHHSFYGSYYDTPYYSKSQWEISLFKDTYFYSLPELCAPPQVTIHIPNNLPYRDTRKLVLYFLKSVRLEGYEDKLLEAATTITETFFSRTTTFKVINPIDIKEIVESFKNRCQQSEMLSLYLSNIDTLLSVRIKIEQPWEEKTKGSDNSENERKEGNKETENGKYIKDILDKIEQYVPFSERKHTSFDKDFRNVPVVQYKLKDEYCKDSNIIINLTEEELACKNKLKLTLNWDSGKIIHNNLRNGKLDVRKLGEIFTHNPLIFSRERKETYVKPFKVVFLLDYSGSMALRIELQKKIVKILTKYFEENSVDVDIYGHTSHFGYTEKTKYFSVCGKHLYINKKDKIKKSSIDFKEFCGDPDCSVLVNIYSTGKSNFDDGFACFKACWDMRENYDGHALEALVRSYENDDKQLLYISISDGEPAGRNYDREPAVEKLKQELEKLRRRNMVTVGILLNYWYKEQLYDYQLPMLFDEDDYDKESFISTFAMLSMLINRAIKENFIVQA